MAETEVTHSAIHHLIVYDMVPVVAEVHSLGQMVALHINLQEVLLVVD
jgi:hypothetical protein